MKFIVFFLTTNLAVGLSAYPQYEFYLNERSISSAIKTTLENIKNQMPCGLPEYNLPILAPYKNELLQADYKYDIFTILAVLKNIRVDGLNKFDITEASFSIWTLKLNYDINFSELNATGQHYIKSLIINAIKLSGYGDIDFKLKNLRLKGYFHFKASLWGVSMKAFEVKLTLGGVDSNISGLNSNQKAHSAANEIIEQFLMTFFKEKSVWISQVIYDYINPPINDYLSKLSLKDLIQMITKSKPPVECIPNENILSKFILL